MIMPLMTTEQLSNLKVKLSVPLITKLLLDGKTQTQIATMCNITIQSVSGYIKRHYDEIIHNAEPTGQLLALKNKLIASKTTSHIDKILSDEKFTKKDLHTLSVVNGVATDKMRLLQGESTQNVSVKASASNIKDLDNQLDVLQSKLDQL